MDREELTEKLNSVTPGLAQKDVVEQSSCFVFSKGHVITYNEGVACRNKCDIGMEGAVNGNKLLEILEMLPDKDIQLTNSDGELKIKNESKRRRCGITMEDKIILPIETVEEPGKWAPLPEDFLEALGLILPSTARKHDSFFLTCVHFHPKYLEGCDNFQMARYPLNMKGAGVNKPTIAKAEAIRCLLKMKVKEMSITKGWLHFRDNEGLSISCRRYMDTYPDLSGYFEESSGEPITLPGGLGEAVAKAEVFSTDNPEQNLVGVTLIRDNIKIHGFGSAGWFKEVVATAYTGPEVAFSMPPDLLIGINSREGFRECTVSDKWLCVEGEKWRYRTALGEVQ